MIESRDLRVETAPAALGASRASVGGIRRRTSVAAAILWLVAPGVVAGQPVTFALNQYGYLSGSAKVFAAQGAPSSATFDVIDAAGTVAYTGPVTAHAGDFGTWVAGDFSALAASGTYRVRIGAALSPPFFIEPSAFSPSMAALLSDALRFCRKTRRGQTWENWIGQPTHLDGIRTWNRDVPPTFGPPRLTRGGHYEASDVRYMGYTYVWLHHALLRLHEELGGTPYDGATPWLHRAAVREEIRWCCDFWISFIAADGFVWARTESNWLTDNILDSGDEPATSTYGLDAVHGAAEELIYCLVESARILGAHGASQAETSVLLDRARAVAIHQGLPGALGGSAEKRAARVLAFVAAWRLAEDPRWLPFLHAALADLLALRVAAPPGGQAAISGIFADDVDPGGGTLMPTASWGRFGVLPIALAQALEALPVADPARPVVAGALASFFDDYVLRFDVFTHPATATNALCMAPVRLYWGPTSAWPVRSFQGSGLGYRYLRPGAPYCSPVTMTTLALGFGAELTGRLLDRADLRACATRCFDHALGFNLAGRSVVENYGTLEIPHYAGNAGSNGPGSPWVLQPEIDAGVKNGLRAPAGSDTPAMIDGWASSEYWQVNQAHFITLLAARLRDGG